MSERPYTPPGDDDLDAALRARRRLLPRFDAHVDDEPSPELDRLVLTRAREALQRETPPERHYRSPRWAAPVAIAATVLLSLGLVLQMDPARNDAVLDAGDAATAMATTEPAVPEQSAELADAPAVATPQPAATPAPAAVAAPPPAALAAPSPPAAPPQAAPPAITSNPVPPPAAPPRDRATQAARDPAAEPAPAAGARIESVAKSRGAAADSSTTSAAEFAEIAAADAAIPRDDPQRWLAAIERLRVAGDVDAARRELAAFRRRHPGVPLPDALDALH